MQVPCPKNHSFSIGLDSSLLKTKTVSIFNEVCEQPDICKDSSCKYYDISSEATELFMKGMQESETIQGLLKDKENEKLFIKKHELTGKDKIYIVPQPS